MNVEKPKRYFNTSGPNRLNEHYTLQRESLVSKGIELVQKERYFTIWAPRQTGKTTYISLLTDQLKASGHKITGINLENFREEPLPVLMTYLVRSLNDGWGTDYQPGTFGMLYNDILQSDPGGKRLLMVDEIDGLNPELFNQFLHTIRNLYQCRDKHGLKSVILVGVSNITGIVQDNASPFNIADNLEIPYFTPAETKELLHMHETDTGQVFAPEVKEKISHITANQPGLVNGFAYKLVEKNPDKAIIDHGDYLRVEDWYLTETIDKNIANIINKASQHREFVQRLLFTETREKFKINDEKIRFLHSHGLIRKSEGGYVEFWVPMYKKAVYDAFYPYSNGEVAEQMREINLRNYFLGDNGLNFDRLVEGFRTYVGRRGFRYFREKDKTTGKWKHTKEAAMVYSFESFVQLLLQEVGGKSYLEPHTGLGQSDLIININGQETVMEFKIFRSRGQFEKGKKQLCHYAVGISVLEAVYFVFVPNYYRELRLEDSVETMDRVKIFTYIIYYDETKDF